MTTVQIFNSASPTFTTSTSSLGSMYTFYKENPYLYTNNSLRVCYNLQDFTPAKAFFNDFLSA